MPHMSFQADLKKLGLSDKEAAVYLAALSLGPSPVQPIARKANVARATTYLVLEALIKLGLVTRYLEGEKTLFVAEDPRQLEHLIDKRERELQEERKGLKDLLPKLEAFATKADDRPLVRYYEGLGGLKAIRAEITMYSKPGETWYQLSPVDHMRNILGEDEFSYTKPRKAKRIRSKAIITTKSSKIKKELLTSVEPPWIERKFADPGQYTSSTGLTILPDRVGIGTWSGKIGGAIIESESVATMMRELFALAWNHLDDNNS